MSQAKLEKRKAALAEWIKYVDTLAPEEADILIKPIKDYLDNHPDNQWLPFDPDNIPEAKEGYAMLINITALDKINAFKAYKGEWRIHPLATSLQSIIADGGANSYKNHTYRLIKL